MSAEITIGTRSTSIWLILAIIGGIVGFVMLFINWETISVSMYSLFSTDIKATGLDMLTNKATAADETGDMQYSFIGKLPFIIAILGIIGAIVAILPTFMEYKRKELSIVASVIFLIAVILCIVFFATGLGVDLLAGDDKEELKTIIHTTGVSVKFKAGTGAIIALIASIVGLLASAISVKENL